MIFTKFVCFNILNAQNIDLDNHTTDSIKTSFEFFSKNHILGKYEADSLDDFVKIDSIYTYKDLYLIKEVYDSFLQMASAAKNDSIDLMIISAIRSFNYQRTLWENKWLGKTKVEGHKLTSTHKNTFLRAKKILEYTAPPGCSRHHWGTDIDINAVDDEYFESPLGNKVYDWLRINAGKFGFCQPYTQQELRNGKGFKEEKWHWSYHKLSDPILQEFIKIYSNQIISDFKGFNEVRRIDLLSDYILSINTCN